MTELRADLKKSRGSAMLLENGDWDNPGGGRQATWNAARLGPNPPQATVQLQEIAFREVVACCGINAAMLVSESDGTMARESNRLASAAMEAVGRPVAQELSVKLDADISLDFSAMRSSSDLQARARSFKTLVQGGKTVEEATVLSGLMLPED